MRGWDKKEKRDGNGGYLRENKATQVVLRQNLGGSRDDPGAVKGKENVEGFYKVLFESQVKRHSEFYVLLPRRGRVGGKIG